MASSSDESRHRQACNMAHGSQHPFHPRLFGSSEKVNRPDLFQTRDPAKKVLVVKRFRLTWVARVLNEA